MAERAGRRGWMTDLVEPQRRRSYRGQRGESERTRGWATIQSGNCHENGSIGCRSTCHVYSRSHSRVEPCERTDAGCCFLDCGWRSGYRSSYSDPAENIRQARCLPGSTDCPWDASSGCRARIRILRSTFPLPKRCRQTINGRIGLRLNPQHQAGAISWRSTKRDGIGPVRALRVGRSTGIANTLKLVACGPTDVRMKSTLKPKVGPRWRNRPRHIRPN